MKNKNTKIDTMIDALRPLTKGKYLMKYSNGRSIEFNYKDRHNDIAYHLKENALFSKKTFNLDVIDITKIN